MTLEWKASAMDEPAPGGRRTAAALGMLIGGALAAWWMTGLWAAADTGTDYLPGRLTPTSGWEAGLGILGWLLLAAGAAALVTAARPRDPRWSAVFWPLLAAAALTGFVWRFITLPTVDANIGAGLAAIFCGPLILLLVIVAAVRARRPATSHDDQP